MTDSILPSAAGSQVTVTDGAAAAGPVSRPFVIDGSGDVTGTATGTPNVESYCAWDATAASRYQLNRADHNQIFHFDLTARGGTGPAYCLDKFKDGPYGDVPYQSAPFESLFPDASARQKRMLAWVLANAYPTVSAADTFALAGVDPTQAPALDDNDAFAAVQVALWVLLGQIAPDEVQFLNCGGSGLHPKSARLQAAVFRLLALAGTYADAAPTQAAQPAACPCPSPLLQCCINPGAPADPADPQLTFLGCPCEVRPVCGRLLVGPFTVSANITGTPAIPLEPFCACGSGFAADFADFCGNPIAAPGLGQAFYLAVRACGGSLCFTLNVSLSGTVTRVLTMEPDADNYQPIGATLRDYPVSLTASMCVCVTVPGQDGSCRPGGPGFSGVVVPPICIPGWGYPPIPPYPPAPPYPPYPPQPPYPPVPPYPPFPPRPPYPPYPPYPPCPPEPPKPPCPPCPPEPPCPPCPPPRPCCCEVPCCPPGPCYLPLERRGKCCRTQDPSPC